MKLNLKKVIPPFVIGLVAGLVIMYIYSQTSLTYQGSTFKQWSQAYNLELSLYNSNTKYLEDVASACGNDPSSEKCNPYLRGVYSKKTCSTPIKNKATAAEIVWRFRNCASPTPQVVAQTVNTPELNTENLQPQSNLSRCTPDYAGGMYCTSNTGIRTHCTSNYAGGMNCN